MAKRRSCSPTRNSRRRSAPRSAKCKRDLLVVDIDDPEAPSGERLGSLGYESLLADGDPAYAWPGPQGEWDPLSLLYTSGTTGNPKGVVYHHRGAYLNALGNALAFGLTAQSVYLWTLPMFHCNGWTFTWAVTAAGATHVCLRRVDPAPIFRAIADCGVTHLCGAPVVLNMLVHAPDDAKLRFDHRVDVATGGAAPPSAVIEAMEGMGFSVTHLYGLTETYGPATLCVAQDDWPGLPLADRARRMARQGVPMPTLAGLAVADPATGAPVPRDGKTIGEVLLRGNTVMSGYLKNERATAAAFAGGWLHTGDLAVWHPDNAIEIKDRSKDIIITGGENVSSLEVEECLYRHPRVMEAAVVAQPDDKWGESAVRVRDAEAGRRRGGRGRDHRLVPRASRPFQGAEARGVRPAAEDLDGQDPEVRAEGSRKGRIGPIGGRVTRPRAPGCRQPGGAPRSAISARAAVTPLRHAASRVAGNSASV